MKTWRIPRWALPAAIGGVLAIGAVDAVLMQRHPVSVRPVAMPEQIGLHADADGEGMRVQWDRASRPIRNADRAILYIEDGALQSQLDLTGRQLDSSSVRYWPESERVKFRLEVYRGTEIQVRLLPKLKLEIGVNDVFVDATIEAIVHAARTPETGQVGDGKIFVMPLDDCVRIRTGERGSEAIGP